jgi:hypothetical protein
MYAQFALVIAATALLSDVNAATLKPTQSAMWLRRPVPLPQRNAFYRAFNALNDRAERGYAALIARIAARSGVMAALALAIIAAAGYGFSRVPVGFLPIEDQGHLIASVQLPDGAGRNRGAHSPPGDRFRVDRMSYQEKVVGNQMYVVFGMALLLVYLVLAGEYESWHAPVARPCQPPEYWLARRCPCENGFDGACDCVGRILMTQMLQHHCTRPDWRNGIGDILSENIACRPMDRLEHRREFSLVIEIGRGSNPNRSRASWSEVR